MRASGSSGGLVTRDNVSHSFVGGGGGGGGTVGVGMMRGSSPVSMMRGGGSSPNRGQLV